MEYALPAAAFFGVLLFFWGVSGLLSAGGTSVEERMARYAGGADAQKKESRKKSEKKSSRAQVDPFATLSGDVQDKRFATKVQRDLARANLKLRVAEYYYIRIGAALGLGPFLGYMLPRFYVGRRIGGRLAAFNKQLPDTITLLSNSLRAGSSFLQSI